MLYNYKPGESMYSGLGKDVEAIAAARQWSAADKGTDKEASVHSAMLDEIKHLQHAHGIGCVSHHQKDPSQINVIDVAAASVQPQKAVTDFVRQLTNSVFVERLGIPKGMKRYSSKHFHETAHCLHLEIPQIVTRTRAE